MSRTGFRPNFDALEAREVPAVSIYAMDGGATLRIIGSRDWDEVRITQDDTNDTLEIYSCVLPKSEVASIASVGTQTFQSSKVRQIIVDLGIGNDAFHYQLATGTDMLFDKQFTVNMGSGDDLVRIDTANPSQIDDTLLPPTSANNDDQFWYLAAGSRSMNAAAAELPPICYAPQVHSTINANLRFTIDTSTGNDRVDIIAGELAPSKFVRLITNLGTGDDSFTLTGDYDLGSRASFYSEVNGGQGNDFIDASFRGYIADQALVNLLLNGNEGNDYLSAGFFGEVDGRFFVRQQGGAGNDELQLNSDISYESAGQVKVQLDGGDGDDSLTYSALGYDAPSLANVLIDGGTGYNIGKLSRDVMCVNLNQVLWLPPLV